ncbi:MAG TPA: 4'-phosphopantetheinyl transferase superfamily protein [Arthrobacter sp.]|nr:4'-phosphopantetheinyl transferase superfamily protein [Arthrobacter sp.]
MGEVVSSGAAVRAVPLGVPSSAELGLLDPAERRRGARFVSAAAADEFLAGRIALRVFAAELAGVRPDALEADYQCGGCRAGNPDHGRPGYRLRDGSAGPLLSLSRAAGWAVLAGARPGGGLLRLGVDAERLGRTDFPGFDAVALTPGERHLVSGSADAGRLRTRFWARKEAFLKATGSGLRRDPAMVDASHGMLEGVLLADLDAAVLGLPGGVVVTLATSPA